jgi:hypothetical protein
MPDQGNHGETPPREGPASPRRPGVKRPLVPLVMALMLGLAAAAWGVRIPTVWLVAGLAGLIIFMLWGLVRLRSGRERDRGRESR